MHAKLSPQERAESDEYDKELATYTRAEIDEYLTEMNADDRDTLTCEHGKERGYFALLDEFKPLSQANIAPVCETHYKQAQTLWGVACPTMEQIMCAISAAARFEQVENPELPLSEYRLFLNKAREILLVPKVNLSDYN